MTNTELREWIKSRGLTQREAAEILAMSIDGLRKNVQGVTPVGPQTERLIKLLDELDFLIQQNRKIKIEKPIVVKINKPNRK